MKSIKIINPVVRNITKLMSKIVKHTSANVCDNGMSIKPENGSITALDGKILISVENIEEIRKIDIEKTWDINRDEIPVEVEQTKTSIYLTALDGRFPNPQGIFDKKEGTETCGLFPKKENGFSIFYSAIVSQYALKSEKEVYINIDYLKIIYDLLMLGNCSEFDLSIASKKYKNPIFIDAILFDTFKLKVALMPIFLVEKN